MMTSLAAATARAFRRTWAPLGAYYAVTVVIPLANDGVPDATFVHHAVMVLLVPPVIITLVCSLSVLCTAYGILRTAAPPPPPATFALREQPNRPSRSS